MTRKNSAAGSRSARRIRSQWKLSPIDLGSLDKWDEVHPRRKEAMFFADTADAPWTVISPIARSARAERDALRAAKVPYASKDVEPQIRRARPLLVGRAHVVYERGEGRRAIL